MLNHHSKTELKILFPQTHPSLGLPTHGLATNFWLPQKNCRSLPWWFPCQWFWNPIRFKSFWLYVLDISGKCPFLSISTGSISLDLWWWFPHWLNLCLTLGTVCSTIWPKGFPKGKSDHVILLYKDTTTNLLNTKLFIIVERKKGRKKKGKNNLKYTTITVG